MADFVTRVEDARFEAGESRELLADLQKAAEILRPYHFPMRDEPHNEGDAAYRDVVARIRRVQEEIDALQERWSV